MHEGEATQKPDVGSTRQQAFSAKNINTVTEAQRCAMYGGTAVVAGTLLLLIQRGLTKWLG